MMLDDGRVVQVAKDGYIVTKPDGQYTELVPDTVRRWAADHPCRRRSTH